ncbi:MAG TPA: Hsp70 family protein, partial [Chloroflexota bacterium]
TVLIPRNTTIPTQKKEVFTTAEDGQTRVEIHVLQGERPMARDNKSLARFILDGIPPAPRGVPQIEVTFDVDANGILSVSARDLATGREQRVVVQPSSGLSREEVERLVREAQLHAEEDRRKREEAELRNRADAQVYAAEKILREHDTRLPPDVRSALQARLEEVRRLLKEPADVAALAQALSALESELTRAGEAVYTAGAAGAARGGGSSWPNTVEGEYREV